MEQVKTTVICAVLIWGLLLLPVPPEVFAQDPDLQINTVIETPDMSDFCSDLMGMTACRGYASDGMKEFSEPIRRQISASLDTMKEKFGIDVKALSKLMTGRVRLELNSEKKRFALFAQPGEEVDISANVESLKKVLKHKGSAFKESSISGVSLLTVTEQGDYVTVAYTKEKFLFSYSDKDISVGLVSELLLGKTPLYNSTLPMAAPYPELKGEGLHAYSRNTPPDFPVPGLNIRGMFEAANIPGMAEAVSRTFIRDDRLCGISFIKQNMNMGFSSMLKKGPVSDDILSWTHESCTSVSAFHVQLDRFPAVVKDILTASGSLMLAQQYDMILPRVKQMTGLDVEQDLFASLGDEVLFCVYPSGKGGGFPVMSLLGLNNIAAVLKLKNPAGFEKSTAILTALLGNLAGMDRVGGGVRKIMHKGTYITYIKAFSGALSPCFAVKDGYAVFTSNVPLMRFVLDSHKRAPVTDTEEYRATLAETGAEPGSVFMYQRGVTEAEGAMGRNLVNPLIGLSVAGILAGMIVPVLGRAREEGRSAACKNCLRMIGTACAMYSMSHSENYPPNLEALVPDQISDRAIFRCKSDTRPGISYVYLPGLNSMSPSNAILAFDRFGNHHDGRNVVFVDAHVEWMNEAGFKRELAKMLQPKYRNSYTDEARKTIQLVLAGKLPIPGGGGPAVQVPDPLFDEQAWQEFLKTEAQKIGSSVDFALFPAGDIFPGQRKSNFTAVTLKENGIYSEGFTGHIVRPGGGTSAPVMIAVIAIMAAIAIPSLIKSKIAANEGCAAGTLKTMNGMLATYKKKGYAGLGRRYPVGYDPQVKNSGKFCGLYYEVNNAKESVMLIGAAEAAADYRSSKDPTSPAGSYVPSVNIAELKYLPEVTFRRAPKQGYWFALMKYYNDGMGNKIAYDLQQARNHYALVAWPADYGESGEITFIINEEGTVYMLDLGRGEYIDTYPGPNPAENGWEIAQ